MKYLRLFAILFFVPTSSVFAGDVEDEIKRHAKVANVNILMVAINLKTTEAPAALTGKGDEMLVSATVAFNPQKAVFQATTGEVIVELLGDESRH